MALNSADVKKLLQDHDLGLLFIRLFIGAAMIAYGIPKFMHGEGASTTDTLAKIGSAMGFIGIKFAPVFWGFLAAMTEIVGGFMILMGFLFRPAAALLAFVMFIATLLQAHSGKDFVMSALHPLTYLGVFLGLLFSGPGKWSIQKH